MGRETIRPRIGDDFCYNDEENGRYYWRLRKKYNLFVKEWEDQMLGPDSVNITHSNKVKF